ncbi:unnamed protein product [Mytilus edulis]|uniref:Uncharacterized protein n=1 Tax=Mytilus edulis TaxID=6550 RepID=A0A8S3RIX8_MYTED|nr:unnamed protein product [Mytilus edulis]
MLRVEGRTLTYNVYNWHLYCVEKMSTLHKKRSQIINLVDEVDTIIIDRTNIDNGVTSSEGGDTVISSSAEYIIGDGVVSNKRIVTITPKEEGHHFHTNFILIDDKGKILLESVHVKQELSSTVLNIYSPAGFILGRVSRCSKNKTNYEIQTANQEILFLINHRHNATERTLKITDIKSRALIATVTLPLTKDGKVMYTITYVKKIPVVNKLQIVCAVLSYPHQNSSKQGDREAIDRDFLTTYMLTVNEIECTTIYAAVSFIRQRYRMADHDLISEFMISLVQYNLIPLENIVNKSDDRVETIENTLSATDSFSSDNPTASTETQNRESIEHTSATENVNTNILVVAFNTMSQCVNGIQKSVDTLMTEKLLRFELDADEEDIIEISNFYGNKFYDYHTLFSAKASTFLQEKQIKVDWSKRDRDLMILIGAGVEINICKLCHMVDHDTKFCPLQLSEKSVSTPLLTKNSGNSDIRDASSTIGFGGYFGGKWFYSSWPTEIKNITNSKHSMAFFELYPIVVAAVLWGASWKTKKVLFWSDNMSTVEIIRKGRSKCLYIMKLMRKLTWCACTNNFFFSAKHVPGVQNDISDALSRFQIQRFRTLAPDADTFPEPCPKISDVIWC